MQHRDDIDGLRSIAIIPVILFHLGFSFIPGGFVGVDVFFVISGFLITGIIDRESREGRFSLSRFYERRARRILPALFAMTIVTYCLGWLYLAPNNFRDLGASLIFSSLFSSNFYFWRSIGYFEVAANLRPLLHTWSLAVEEQFYIIFPVILSVSNRLPRARTLIIVTASIISFLIAIRLGNSPAAFYLLPARWFELGVGSILALLQDRYRVGRAGANVLGAAGLIAIGASLFLIDETLPFPGPWAILPTLGSALVLYAGKNGEGVAARVLSTAPLKWIGLISYSAYIWHWPIIVGARFWLAGPLSEPMRFTLVFITFAVAIVSWKWIEQPFRDRKSISTAAIFRLACGFTLVTCILGAIGWVSGGLPSRFPFGPTPAGAESVRVHTCFLEFGDSIDAWSSTRCAVKVGSGGETVFLWGDSFSAHYAPGIESLSAQGIALDLVQANFAACPPFFGDADRLDMRCSRFNQKVLESIRNQHPKTVILAASWSHDQRAFGEDEHELYKIITSTIAELTKSKVKNIILIGDSPRFYLDVEQLNIRPGLPVARPLNDFRYNAVLEKAAAQVDAQYVDPAKILCTKQGCRIRDASGAILQWDDGHFTIAGSRLMAREMLSSLLQRQ